MNRVVFLILTGLITAGALIAFAYYRRMGGVVAVPDIAFYGVAAAIVLLPYVRVIARGKACARK